MPKTATRSRLANAPRECQPYKRRDSAPKPKVIPSNIDEFRDQIITNYKKRGAKASTLRGAHSIFKIMTEAGIKRLTDLDDKGVMRVIRFIDRKADLALQTRAQHKRMLRTVCHQGVDMGVFPAKQKFPPIPEPEDIPNAREIPVLSRDEARRLLKHLYAGIKTWKGHRLYALVVTAMFTGLLRNEIYTVHVDDLDLEKGIIRVPRRERFRKSPRPAVVQLGDKPKSVLSSWVLMTGSEWLFPGDRKERPWNSQGSKGHGAAGQLRAAGAAVGISNLTFLSLRKFYEQNIERSIAHLEGIVGGPTLQPAVQLGRISDPAIVLGQERKFQTPSEYKVIKALVDVFPLCIREKELRDRSGMETARRILETMRMRDPLWRAATKVPGKGYYGSLAGIGIVALS